MRVDQIKQIVNRTPFRPFTVRLSNGATYDFKEPREFGAPRDMHTLFFFGEKDWVLIDPFTSSKSSIAPPEKFYRAHLIRSH